MLKSILISSLAVVALGITSIAQANTNQFTLGYQNNNVNDTRGVSLEVATQLQDNLIVGLNTQFDDWTINQYGAFVGTPIKLGATPITVTPKLGVEHYQEESATVGSAAVKAAYLIDSKTDINAEAKYSKSFSNEDGLEGGTYIVGLTRHF